MIQASAAEPRPDQERTPPAEAGPARGRRLLSAPGLALAALLPTLAAALIFVLYFQAQPHWLADPDAQDYAQLGRQIAAGRGPTSRFMPWNGLDYLAGRPDAGLDGPWPNISRFPLVPAVMALAFATLGVGDGPVHLPDGLAYVLAAGCAGLLGARAYSALAGLLAGLATAALPLLVNYSLTGLTEPTLGLLVLATLACLVGSRSGGARALAGAFFGLAVLTRYDTLLLALPIAALWLLPRSDWRRATTLFVCAAAVVVLPWSVYLLAVAGGPLFNLQAASIAAQASGLANGLGWYLPRYVAPTEVWQQNPGRAANLMLSELAATPNLLRKLLGWPWLLAGTAACLLALVVPLARSPRRLTHGSRLVLFLLAAVLLKALTASGLGLNLQRHYVSLMPLLVVIVAGEAEGLLARVLRGGVLTVGRVILGALLVLPSLWIIGPFLVPSPGSAGPPNRTGEVEVRPENLARLAEIVGPDRLVASNVPWSVAWQADRRAVPLPPTVAETPDLERRFGLSIDAIYVAGQVAVDDAPRTWREWEDLRRQGKPPPGYILAESFANGGRLFLKER